MFKSWWLGALKSRRSEASTREEFEVYIQKGQQSRRKRLSANQSKHEYRKETTTGFWTRPPATAWVKRRETRHQALWPGLSAAGSLSQSTPAVTSLPMTGHVSEIDEPKSKHGIVLESDHNSLGQREIGD